MQHKYVMLEIYHCGMFSYTPEMSFFWGKNDSGPGFELKLMKEELFDSDETKFKEKLKEAFYQELTTIQSHILKTDNSICFDDDFPEKCMNLDDNGARIFLDSENIGNADLFCYMGYGQCGGHCFQYDMYIIKKAVE